MDRQSLSLYTSWNLNLTKGTICSQTIGIILYNSHNMCPKRTHILLVPCDLIESKTYHKKLDRSFKRVKWFSPPMVTFLSLGGKIKGMFVSSVMLTCQQWWIQSTGTVNPKGNQKLFISTPTICWESIDQIKCCCLTLHCKKLWKGIKKLENLLNNTYYMYSKAHSKQHERFLRINSKKLDWFSSSKLPFEAISILHHFSNIPPTKNLKNAVREGI